MNSSGLKFSPILDMCVKAWHAHDLSTCKPLGFDLLGWIAIAGAIASIILVLAKLLRRNRQNPNRLRWSLFRTRFRALCRAIRPIMDENGRIFLEFGPNSGAAGPARVVRQDVSVWKQLLPKVAENNARIRSLIVANKDGIPERYSALFQRWVDHIDAFTAHAQDDLADYRNHQFPRDVVDVVHRHG